MSFTISDAKTRIQRKLHGTSLSKLTAVYDLFAEAGWNVISEIDPAETIRITQLSGKIFDRVYDYALPADVKGNKVIDIRPQVNRTVSDNFSQWLEEEFDLKKSLANNKLQVRFDDTTKSLRIDKELTVLQLVNGCDGLTDNGTWAATASATNLAADAIDYIEGAGSLSFDLSAAGSTGYIENSTMTQVDLSDIDEKGAFFLWVYLPAATNFTNVILRWGNSSTAYWSRTVTAPHTFSAFQNGWNLLRFDWSGATETGTVDPNTIDYLRVTFTYDGTAQTGVKVDQIQAGLGKIFEIAYYSKYLFRDSSGTWIEKPTSDDDIINLDTDSYNLFIYETCYLIAQELQGEDASFDANFFEKKLRGDGTERNPGLYKRYKKSNPGQTILPQSTYYQMPPQTYPLEGRWLKHG